MDSFHAPVPHLHRAPARHKELFLKKFVMLVAAALLTLPAFAVEVGPETVPGQVEPLKNAADMDFLHQWLLDHEGAAAKALVVEVSPEESARLKAAPTNSGRLLVGSSIAVDLPVGSTKASFGSLQEGVWAGAIASPGATAMRLHLADLNLPKGASLYVYNAQGDAFGPYLGKGTMGNGAQWTHTVTGSEIRLQVHFQGAAEKAGSFFTIQEVGYLGENFLFGQTQNPNKAFCSFNESCIENAACQSVPGAISANANGIAHLLYSVGSSFFICSGGLLNDTDAATQRPLLLTANHCFDTAASATSLEAYFQYTTPCGGTCFNPYSASLPRTVGSTILATSSSSDYTLVELSQAAPAGSTLLGWSTTAVANSAGTNLFRLSHPKGAPQAYSTHSVNTTAGTCGVWPRGPWIYSDDTLGATEGGSSGSPVLNASGQVVGQLSGACGSSPAVACNGGDRTVDGALAAYFGSVSQFLDPSSGPGGNCPAGYTELTGSATAGGPDQITNVFRDSGTFDGILICSGADLDLHLDRTRRNGNLITTVASSTSSGCNEQVTYTNNRNRYYRWRVEAFSGSASFTLCVNKP